MSTPQNPPPGNAFMGRVIISRNIPYGPLSLSG
jgi:hypothetical protein